MAKCKLVLKMPWWASLYICSCVLFAKVFGVQPNIDKISSTVVNRAKVKVE
ncbi:hypothetical protein [Vibrio phage vB_VaS_L1]|nr:hypothetical protein [Vibrio phage vB_VaS_L1]